MQIYINRDGQQFGPLTIEQINQALVTGQLLPTDLAFHEGLANWTPLTQIQGVILPGQPGQQAIPAQLVSAGAPVEPAAESAVEVAAPVAAGGNKQLFLYIGIGVGVMLIGFLVWYFLIRLPTVETPELKPKNGQKPNDVNVPPNPPGDGEPEESVTPEYAEGDLPASVAIADIRMIFNTNCIDCHKADKKEGDLDLSSPEGIQAAIDGQVIILGFPRKSPVVERVHLPPDDDDVMPQKGKGEPLTDEEKKKIYKWILDGAKLE